MEKGLSRVENHYQGKTTEREQNKGILSFVVFNPYSNNIIQTVEVVNRFISSSVKFFPSIFVYNPSLTTLTILFKISLSTFTATLFPNCLYA